MTFVKMTVFWRFLEFGLGCQIEFFTEHRAQWDTSFDIKLYEKKNWGAELVLGTLCSPYLLAIQGIPLTFFSFSKLSKTDFIFGFSSKNCIDSYISHIFLWKFFFMKKERLSPPQGSSKNDLLKNRIFVV